MPQTFTDTQGRTWSMGISVAAVSRCRERLDIDLPSLLLDEKLVKVAADPVAFCDLLWVILERQAKEHGVTEDDFAECFDFAVLRAAGEAFVEALIDFFQPARANLLRKGMLRATELDARMIETVAKKIDDGSIDETLRQTMQGDATSSPSATSSPDSSASTPDH